MLFDLQSGKRRRVVQVVFGFLAFIFFISFVGFGIGSDVTGGIFDALGIGGSNNSSDPQYEQQIEDAQAAIDANPNDGAAYASLIQAYFSSAQQGISRDQQTGQPVITTDANADLQKAAQAWDDYMKTKPQKVDVNAAASAVQVFYTLSDAGGAAEAQAVVADDAKTVSAFVQLALYYYADGQLKQGDAAGQQAADVAADAAERKQVEKTIDGYRKAAVKFQQQQQQAQQQGGSEAGQQQLEDPFGGLGGVSGAAPQTTP